MTSFFVFQRLALDKYSLESFINLETVIFFRWKRTSAGLKLDGGKKVLEFVAIQRKDNSQWAIPGVRKMT